MVAGALNFANVSCFSPKSKASKLSTGGAAGSLHSKKNPIAGMEPKMDKPCLGEVMFTRSVILARIRLIVKQEVFSC